MRMERREASCGRVGAATRYGKFRFLDRGGVNYRGEWQ
jgi:hypothetical protein